MGPRRTQKNNLISGILIVILLVLIFFLPSYGWQLRAWLSPSVPSSAFGNVQGNATSTAAEVETLQSQLAQYQAIASQLPGSASSTANYIRGMVYSRYPLNFKNEILVNVGSDDGVQQGAAVIFQGILIGQVQKVFADYAVVQTIFDNGVKMPVRVGSTGADGLLQGGSQPIVGSISNTAPVLQSDIVYSAAPGLPYGLPVGTIAATSTSPDSLFQQATLNFGYDINSIQTVFIAN